MATKRQSIGTNPLDSIIPGAQPEAHPAPPAPAPKAPKAPTRQRVTFNAPIELVPRIRNAVVALMGPPPHGTRLTLSRFMESAIVRELARLEAEHNGGQPFPNADEGIKRGRPFGS